MKSFQKVTLYINVITEDIMPKYVKSLDIAKPSGIPNLKNRLVADALKVLVDELTALFNESMIQEIFPEEWKLGVVTPIPKSGNLMIKTH